MVWTVTLPNGNPDDNYRWFQAWVLLLIPLANEFFLSSSTQYQVCQSAPANTIIILFPFAEDLSVCLLQVVLLEEEVGVFLAAAQATSHLINQQQCGHHGHVEDKGLDFPQVEVVVAVDGQQAEGREGQDDQFDQDASHTDCLLLLLAELSRQVGTMRMKPKKRAHTSMKPQRISIAKLMVGETTCGCLQRMQMAAERASARCVKQRTCTTFRRTGQLLELEVIILNKYTARWHYIGVAMLQTRFYGMWLGITKSWRSDHLQILTIFHQTLIMQNPWRSLSAVLCCCLLVAAALSLTTTPQFTVTNKYIETGTAVLDTSPYFGVPAQDSRAVVVYICTFTRFITSYDAITSIQSLNYQISANNRINATTYVCDYYIDGLDLCVISTSYSQMSVLSSRYLVLDTAFNKITHFYAVVRFYIDNEGSVTFDSANPVVKTFNLPGGLNTTGTLRTFAFINGFNATASSSTNSFDIGLTTTYTSATVIQVTISSTIATPVQLSSVMFSLLGYNEDEAQLWPFPAGRITLGTFTQTSPFADANSIFQTYNTFWGLTSLSISNDNFIDFGSSLGASISASTTNTGAQYNWQAMVFEFKECDATTPYYMVSQGICYDDCPTGYYQSNVQMTCETCDTSCLTCSAGTAADCGSCPSGRVLSGSSCPSCTQAVGAGCSACLYNGTDFVCTTCVGSTLVVDRCVFNQPQKSSKLSLLWILLIVLGGVLCCSCIILFICWRRKKEKQNKVKQQAAKNNGQATENDEGLPEVSYNELTVAQNKEKQTKREENSHQSSILKPRKAPLQANYNKLDGARTTPKRQVGPLKEPSIKKLKIQPIAFVQGEKGMGSPTVEDDIEIIFDKYKVYKNFEQIKGELEQQQRKVQPEGSDEFKSQSSDNIKLKPRK